MKILTRQDTLNLWHFPVQPARIQPEKVTSGVELLAEENRPKYETIQLYLGIIGLEFIETIKAVGVIPKLF